MASEYSFFADGSRRLADALKGIPGPVPVYAQIHEFAAANTGIPSRIFYSQAEIMVPAILETQRRLGFEVASLTYDVYNIEAEALGQPILFTEAGLPDIDRAHPLIRGPDDLARIHTPDFEHEGRFTVVIEMMRHFESLTGIWPSIGFCAPFTLAANLRGIESLLIDIYETPEFARSLLQRLTEEVIAPWILYQKACFPSSTGISGSDAIASLPIINLPIIREWVIPWIERLRVLVNPNVSVSNWVGERFLKQPLEMLDLKRKISPGSLRGQDPDVEILGAQVYRQYAQEHGIPLILGVGAAFLNQATPNQVAERVEQYIRDGRPSTGFALYLCNVGATTPPENVIAAIQAAHRVV